ncbi:MAG: hypothetical protein IPJ30_21600 [Acidobacteria bacterium]|nr:hypothetical protein [Acidobacteriota bacterium]
MMVYVLICLCLSLAGVAGLQFFYMAYIERLNYEQKKRIAALERRVRSLGERANERERLLADNSKLIETRFDDIEVAEEEVWADVIEER